MPELALLGALVVIALLAALVGIHIRSFSLDETLFKASAVRYGQGLPDTLLHDNAARASSRLYALTLMPIFKAFDGDVAIRVAKAYNAALWISTALPVYGIGLRVLRDRRLAALAAFGAVAAPWMLLTTALFSESMAYAAAAWVAWAMLCAALRPAWWRDLVVIAAILVAATVRVQLAALVGAWLVVALVVCWLEAVGPSLGARLLAAGRGLRRFPVLVAVVAFAVLVVLWFVHKGQLGYRIDEGLGDYGTFDDRSTVPTQVGLGALVEVLLIALGVGVLPFLLAVGYVSASLRRRVEWPEAFWFSVVALAAIAALWALTLAAQSGYIGPLTEERYFVYAVPLLWIAALGAVQQREAVQRRTLLVAGLGLAVLAATTALPRTLSPEVGFLAPVSGLVSHGLEVVVDHAEDLLGLGGLAPQDVLLVVLAVVAVALSRLWDRWPTWRGQQLAIGVGLAVQLGLLAYGLTAAVGWTAGGAGARDLGTPFAAAGWIDRSVGDQGVQWLESEPRTDRGLIVGLQRETQFWNDRVGFRTAIAGAPAQVDATPLDTLPLRFFIPDARTGVVGTPSSFLVQWSASPLLQATGQVVARSPGGQYELVEPTSPVRLRWLASGLGDDGAVLARKTTRLRAWPSGTPMTAKLTFAPPPASPPGSVAGLRSNVSVQLGGVRRTLQLQAGDQPVEVDAPLCGTRVDGTVRAQTGLPTEDGRRVGALLTRVELVPGGRCG